MKSTVSQFKCPNCGASIPFDTTSQKLKCQHCDTEYDVDNLKAFSEESEILNDDFSWQSHEDSNVKDDSKQIYTCPSCGGEVVGDESMAACACPYCGNSVILASKFAGMLKPDLVIPFKYSKQEALDKFKNFCKGKPLLPNDFAINNIINKLNGIYVPYWLFDCDSSCSSRFRATRVSTYMHGDYEITNTDHFLVYRDGEISFENVPVDASSKLSAELLESLEPFEYKDGVDFNTAYLSGFFADKYDENKDDAIKRANERIRNSTFEAINSTVIGYTTIFPESSNVRIKQGISKYALLPIYVFNTTYKGKQYTFAMNGQTGKMSGNLPSDNTKFFTILFSVLFGSFIILFIILRFLVK